MTHYNKPDEPSQQHFNLAPDKAEIFSGFVNNLIENMRYPPAEVHKEISDRPWDFV